MLFGIILAVIAVLFVGAMVSRYFAPAAGRSTRSRRSGSGDSWWAGGVGGGASCGSSGGDSGGHSGGHSCGGSSPCGGGGGSSCGGGGGCGGGS